MEAGGGFANVEKFLEVDENGKVETCEAGSDAGFDERVTEGGLGDCRRERRDEVVRF